MNNLATRDGEIYLIEEFLAPEEAASVYRRLLEELDWREELIVIAGRRIKVPRLMCWYGEEGAIYTYSGVRHTPLPWTPALRRLKESVEARVRQPFNSVLGNLYRDGSDSMGWHADNERELGKNPFIASLSLGQERLFKIRHDKNKETLCLLLRGGSLLLMGGALQHHWRHCVPKTRRPVGPRINLTFRHILKTETKERLSDIYKGDRCA